MAASAAAESASGSAAASVIIDGFAAGIADGSLAWYCDPKAWMPGAVDGQREGVGGDWNVDEEGQLVISPPAKKDFWRKTYYTPVLCKDDGSCLFATIPAGETVMVETSFTLDPKKQFDQAGLCIRLDNEHWVKTGIEVVDGEPRLSCVVCNSYSDWSTQPWPEPALRIRVHKIGSSLVVEAGKKGCSDDSMAFIRIAHLSLSQGMSDDPLVGVSCNEGAAAPPGSVWMGVFACCPEDQDGCTAVFHHFSIRKGTTFEHNADGNHEKPASGAGL
jgi:regulation of enolase protein 1 (concanavalin A-like superfamily)